MRAYQLTLFDESLSLVPRFQIERTIRAIPADWQEDNGKALLLDSGAQVC